MDTGVAGMIISLASPLLVFIAAILGVYVTTKRDAKKEKLDEVKFLVGEIKQQKSDAQLELERVKVELRQVQAREANCLERLNYLKDIVVNIRGSDDGRFRKGNENPGRNL